MHILEKIKSALISPRNFFRAIKKEKGVQQAFVFSVLLSPISLILGILLNLQSSSITDLVYLLNIPYEFAAAVVFITGWLVSIAVPFIVAAVYHLLALLFKGKGKYEATYKVAVYSSVPTYLLGWLWYPFSLAVALWGFALLVLGLKELHSFKLLRAFIVASIPYAVLFLLLGIAYLIFPPIGF